MGKRKQLLPGIVFLALTLADSVYLPCLLGPVPSVRQDSAVNKASDWESSRSDTSEPGRIWEQHTETSDRNKWGTGTWTFSELHELEGQRQDLGRRKEARPEQLFPHFGALPRLS